MFSVVINMSWHFSVCCLLLCVFFLKDGTNYFSYETNLALRTVAIIFAVITNLASVGSKIAIEKDWVVVIAKNDIEKLTSMNSIFRTIDLVSFRALVAIPRILFIFFALFGDDPKTKFLRLFLSDYALCPPPSALQPGKNFSWLCPSSTSDLWPGANPTKIFTGAKPTQIFIL